MADSKAVKTVRGLAEPLCDGLGLFLWDVKLEKEGANWYLRVYIDRDGGVTIDDCEALHRPLDALLDEVDPIPQSYIFEVCSPGIERRLERPEHFEVCIGDRVRVRFIRPENGEKELTGILSGYDPEGFITLSRDGEEDGRKIELSKTAFVKLDDGDFGDLDFGS